MKNVLIVLNYNDYDTTVKFVESIKNYNILDLIVIIDNDSKDNSYDKLKKLKSKKITVLKSDKNGGYGYGNNIGLKYVYEKYKDCNVIISNPDIIVKEKVIKKLLDDLLLDDKNAIVGPVINTHGKLSKGWKLTNGFKEFLISIPRFGTRFKDKIIGYNEKYYTNGINRVDVVSGCFFVSKLKALKDINYFDEKIFLYYEENVICKKLKDKGYNVLLDNSVEIKHNHSISIDKSHSSLSKFKILKESQMYYLNNYVKASNLSKKMIKLCSKLIINKKS